MEKIITLTAQPHKPHVDEQKVQVCVCVGSGGGGQNIHTEKTEVDTERPNPFSTLEWPALQDLISLQLRSNLKLQIIVI